MADVSLSFADEQFHPLPCGALFWPRRSLLMVADLHLEKGSSFAMRGWLLPPHDSLETLRRLGAALAVTGASRVAALGDSFHDRGGPARLAGEARDRLTTMLAAVEWLWVTGNHDADCAGELGGTTHFEVCEEGIVLRHEALQHSRVPEISGHFHPKVVLELRSGTRVSRRCLALAPGRLVLPAYGAYAGGLGVDDPAFVAALGAAPEAVVPLEGGLIRVAAGSARVNRSMP